MTLANILTSPFLDLIHSNCLHFHSQDRTQDCTLVKPTPHRKFTPRRRVPSRATPRVPALLHLSPFSPPDRDRTLAVSIPDMVFVRTHENSPGVWVYTTFYCMREVCHAAGLWAETLREESSQV